MVIAILLGGVVGFFVGGVFGGTLFGPLGSIVGSVLGVGLGTFSALLLSKLFRVPKPSDKKVDMESPPTT